MSYYLDRLNAEQKADRKTADRRESGGFNSAALTPVAMPCCGTTRRLHDDTPAWKRIRCSKCRRNWLVSYIGKGQFRFRKTA